jgi:DNA-binding HxlR family transcriptional regulator
LIEVKRCPIEVTLERIVGTKWTINIIKNLLLGNCRFRDFLNANPKLSTKVLSQRLKELEREGIIEKYNMHQSPRRIEYRLTEKGQALKGIVYELAIFGIQHYPRDVFFEKTVSIRDAALTEAKKMFKIQT